MRNRNSSFELMRIVSMIFIVIGHTLSWGGVTDSANDFLKLIIYIIYLNKNGKNAVTHFKVLERFRNYTLLEVKIETGRTHQIRVHLSQIGYPVVGDTTYSNGKNEWGIKGQCLHAKSLKFKHPVTGKEMFIEAPLPEYFEEVLQELRKEN